MEQYEIWKPILGYEGIYEISNTGKVKRVLSLNKVLLAGKLMSQRISKSSKSKTGGYYAVKLSKNGERSDFYVHRLVAIAFIPNPENKPEINHIDANKLNISLSNLEWCTEQENKDHAKRMGLLNPARGEKSKQAKITNKIALEIFNDKRTHVEIAKSYNLYPATVGFIKKGSSWSHVTGKKYQRKRLTTEAIIALKVDSLTMSKKQLSVKYNKTISHIENILAGRVCKKQKVI